MWPHPPELFVTPQLDIVCMPAAAATPPSELRRKCRRIILPLAGLSFQNLSCSAPPHPSVPFNMAAERRGPLMAARKTPGSAANRPPAHWLLRHHSTDLRAQSISTRRRE